MAEEKITPVTPEEADDIRVELDLEDGPVECSIITIFECNNRDYIALLPLDENGEANSDGIVYLYRYQEDEQGLPSIEYISDEEEYEIASDRFDELQDADYFDSIPDED